MKASNVVQITCIECGRVFFIEKNDNLPVCSNCARKLLRETEDKLAAIRKLTSVLDPALKG